MSALRDSEGRGVALTRFELADPAQPRTQRDTGIPGHWRSEIVTGLEVTRDGHIALQTLAPEALRRTAAELAASDDGWRWLRDPGAIVRDLYTDAQHRLTARPPDSTHTGNAPAKAALLEQALGTTRTPDGGPPSTVSNGLRTTSIPLHDLNRALVVEAAGEIGTQYSPRGRAQQGAKRATGRIAPEKSPKDQVPMIGGRRPINFEYAGRTHPSGIEFTKQGFPDFKPHSIATVRPKGITGIREIDRALANRMLGYKVTPLGYVWHHLEDGKTMQLVRRKFHIKVKHTGGVAVIENGGYDRP